MALKLTLVGLYAALVAGLFLRRRQMIFYLGLLVNSVASLVSLLVIENGAYITEQGTVGYDIGAFYAYYVYTVLTLLVFFLACRIIPMTVRPRRGETAFYIASGVCLALELWARWASPAASRFEFFDAYGPTGKRLVVLFVTFYYLLFVFSCYQAASFRRRVAIFGIYAALQLLRGDELGGVMEGIIVLATASYLGWCSESGGPRLYRWLRRPAILLLVGALIVGMAWYKMTRVGGLEQFTDRVVLQAHVFWGALAESRVALHPPAPGDVLATAVSLRPTATSPDYGLGRMMVILAGPYAYALMDGGARFTGGYPAVLVLYFGFGPALAVNLVATLLYVLCLALMMHLLARVHWAVFLLAMKLMSGYSTEFYIMGETVQFNLKFFLGLALLAAIVAPPVLARLAPRADRPAPRSGAPPGAAEAPAAPSADREAGP